MAAVGRIPSSQQEGQKTAVLVDGLRASLKWIMAVAVVLLFFISKQQNKITSNGDKSGGSAQEKIQAGDINLQVDQQIAHNSGGLKGSQLLKPKATQKELRFASRPSSNGSGLFVQTHCILDENTTWWPSEDSWERRAPHFLLIGTKKGGTTSLANYLAQHPRILPPRLKELLYFIPFRFQHWQNGTGTPVYVRAAREEMYSIRHDYNVRSIRSQPSTISFEATPDYLLYSTFSMRSILCTAPWAKILITIRNPIDRLFSHYNYLRDPTKQFNRNKNRTFPSFETFLQMEEERLREAGVLPSPEDTPATFYGSQKERDGWARYQGFEYHSDRPLARSLYALQFEEWYETLRAIGRDIDKDVMIVHQEEMQKDPQKVVSGIFEWLGLPDAKLKTDEYKMVTKYSSKEMKNSTQQYLRKLFDPYNKRLYKLLSWEPIWDD